MRVLIVFAALVVSFGCGSAPANNSNANRSNSNMTLSNSNMSTGTVSNSTNSMTNSTSNMSSNSMANSRSNTSTVSNTAKSNTSASNTVAGDKKIKGNKATKIYHLPGCPDYDSVSAANVVTFDTEQEARKAGYKIAGNCK